jgi:hypothetical protein
MFGLILAAAATTAAAQPAAPPPNPCLPAEACRYVDGFPLKDKQGALHRVTVRQWVPYLANGRLTLFPGEVVSLTVSDKGPVVTDATVLTSADRDPPLEDLAATLQKQGVDAGKEQRLPIASKGNPAAVSTSTFTAGKDSLRIAFQQIASGDMMLRVSSAYDKVLAYHAFIVTPGRNGQTPTSVCAVPAAKLSIETWPPPIVAIQVTDFQLQPADTQIVCR